MFDPSVAPGVCTWGGLTAREGIELMLTLTGMRIVAADFNTVSPPALLPIFGPPEGRISGLFSR